MKFLVVSPAYPPHVAGEAEYAAQLVEQLSLRGHQVTLLTNEPDHGFEHLPPHAMANMRDWGWRELPALLRALRRTRADAVVLVFTDWLFKAHPMITFLPLYLKMQRSRAQVLTIFQLEDGMAPRSPVNRVLNKLLISLSRWSGLNAIYGYGALLSAPHAIGALGPAILAHLKGKLPEATPRAVLMPPPPLIVAPASRANAEDARFARHREASDGELRLAYFGYVYAGKGIETLFAALRRMLDEGRNVGLYMVGGGRGQAGEANPFEEKMIRLAQAMGLSDSVHWLAGYSSGSTDPSHDLANADIAVLPFDDGAELRRSSIAVVASAGLPIVTTTPTHQGEDAFVDAHNVLLSEPGNATALAETIKRLADSPALQSQLRAGSRQLVDDWFSWNKSIQLIEQATTPAQAD